MQLPSNDAIEEGTLGTKVSALENRATSQGTLIDRLLDMHSTLTQWTVDTEYHEAAEEVGAILERAIQKARSDTMTTLQTA